jgi:ribA/ribD-fused uncharacterized protein
MKRPAVIDKFEGDYEFLSNFYRQNLPICFEGENYPTVEHAFQAAKTLDKGERTKIRHVTTPGRAKQLGRAVKLRKNWNSIRVVIMLELLRNKFAPEKMANKLRETKNTKLIEGNYWHDNFWGICVCSTCWAIKHKKQNILGKLLMQVRSELPDGGKL